MEYVMSSGHSKLVRGASGLIDEVDEARKVVSQLTKYLTQLGATVHEFHDNVSKTQNENLKNIVKYHNGKTRNLDISVHFNGGNTTTGGCEVYYFDEKEMAAKVSKSISESLGIRDRGAKQNKELYFLRNTNKPAILIEVCFVNHKENTVAYKNNFDKMCKSIAEAITGKKLKEQKEDVRMYKPSNDTMLNATATVLSRFEKKENGISPVHREKLLKGELTESQAIGLIYVAIERGLIVGK